MVEFPTTGGGDKQANKQTDTHTHKYHNSAWPGGRAQIQNTKMQKYKLHICKNTNYRVVVVLIVEV